jgi:hypothetical protein
VKLAVRLNQNSIPFYSTQFQIEVRDPCNPYDCSTTQFKPVDLDNKRNDVEIYYGQGYKPSTGSVWDNTVNKQCGTKLKTLCGPTKFVLINDETGLEVTEFNYIIYKQSGKLVVGVEIKDEKMVDELFSVHIEGYGFDDVTQAYYGTNGTSPSFLVKVVPPPESI